MTKQYTANEEQDIAEYREEIDDCMNDLSTLINCLFAVYGDYTLEHSKINLRMLQILEDLDAIEKQRKQQVDQENSAHDIE